MMFCQPVTITRDKFSLVLFAFRDNHCQARISQLATRELRSAARIPPCCLTNWISAKTIMRTSNPHKRIDRMRAQAGIIVGGAAASAGGRTGMGGGADGKKSGRGLPNRKKGRLIKSMIIPIINCPMKKSMLIRKSSNVPRSEKKPRLSPAGSRLTTTARNRRKNKL